MMYLLCLSIPGLAVAGNAVESTVEVKRIVSSSGIQHVLLSAGQNAGLIEGQVVDVYRTIAGQKHADRDKVKTGRLKLVKVDPEQSVGTVVEDSTAISRIYFRKFPQIMISDLVEPSPVAIVNTQAMMPTVTVSYFDLFIDPKSMPGTYELTGLGRTKLRELLTEYAGAKVSRLLIESHTDKIGASSDNQIESYQRALAVRQFMVDELGFDGERVVAIGLGESESPDDRMVPGYERKHRRITFKALNSTEID
jgi:hypothetical protein